ncbi:MAG: YgfZ/GcvT domain-containing protein [Alphaproteobacteria bacterium]
MAYLHEGRTFIKVSGTEAFDYLQNMVSNDIRPVHQEQRPVYSLLLDSKGKYKFNFFVWPYGENGYLLETSISQVDAMLKMLKFYKLRADIQLEILDNAYVLSSLSKDADFVEDSRLSGLYRKLILDEKPNISNDFDYPLWRLQNGLPEHEDMQAGEDTPIEFGFDELNAITYSKGCFLGQEGTNKAKHRLVIKKRLLPFSVDYSELSSKEIQTNQQKNAGEVRAFSKGYGLAVVKLKYLNQPLLIDGIEIKIHIPNWLSLPDD